jgi:hypothetical protein
MNTIGRDPRFFTVPLSTSVLVFLISVQKVYNLSILVDRGGGGGAN